MSDFVIEYVGAKALGRAHDDDHDALEAIGSQVLAPLDAGAATEILSSIMAAVVEEASEVSLALSRMSVEVLASVNMYRGVEDDAEEAFRRLADSI